MRHAYRLRSLEYHDLSWFLRVRNASRAFLHDSREFSEADGASWWAEGGGQRFRVIEFDGVSVGYMRIGPVEATQTQTLLWVGCDIDPSARRCGHASSAYRAFLPELKAEFHVDGFALRVLATNAIALRLYRRLGFVTTEAEFRWEQKRLEVVDYKMVLSDSIREGDSVDLLLTWLGGRVTPSLGSFDNDL